MFPSFYELINYLLGIELPVFKIVKTFGFIMASAFLVGAIVIIKEFKRLKNDGYLQPIKETFRKGFPADWGEYIGNGIFGFLIGYKLSLFILNFNDFFWRDPELYLFSADGYPLGGLIGAAIFIFWIYRKRKKEELPQPIVEQRNVWPHERVWDIITLAAFSGILGAKLFTWFEDWDGFMSDPLGHLVSLQGLTFYGGLICATAVLLTFAYFKKINLLRLMDVGGMAVMLSYGVGRLGCHFSGDGDWGDPNPHTLPDWLSWLPDWLWAFDYPGNVAKVGVRIPDCMGEYCFVLPNPVYPTPVWEFMMAVIIFGVLWSLRKRLVIYPGLLFAVYLVFNGIERFTIEMIRVNADYELFGMAFSQAQIIAMCLIGTGLILGTILYTYFKKNPIKPVFSASDVP